MEITPAQLTEIDSFFADVNKTLDGEQPEWFQGSRGDHQAKWAIIESSGVSRAHLRFRVPVDRPEFPTIGVIFRTEMVSRIDRASPLECHPNPPTAALFGLPAVVCGTHIHRWADNRRFVEMHNLWNLPVRSPIQDRLDRIDQMFKWYAKEIGVRITGLQWDLEGPPADLFGPS